MSLTCEKQRYLNERHEYHRKNFYRPYCEKCLGLAGGGGGGGGGGRGLRKKDRDPTILTVTNIHTRFSCLIREYPRTRILTAALAITRVMYTILIIFIG